MNETQNDIEDKMKGLKNLISKNIEKHFREKVTRSVDEHVTVLTNRLFEEINKNKEYKRSFLDKDLNDTDFKKEKKEHSENGKVFMKRNSLLTDLIEIPHIRSVYHFFLATLILFFITSILHDYFNNGTIDFGIPLMLAGFGKFDKVILIWTTMQCTVLLPYATIFVWSKFRKMISSNLKIVSDLFVLALYVIYLCILIIYPIALSLRLKLPIVSGIIVITEMVRFLMKSHAFVRSMIPRVITDDKSSKLPLPTFVWYLYFLFAPTLVYRDAYPRTDSIRWKYVLGRVAEFIACLFYMNFLIEHCVIRPWKNFGLVDVEIKYLVLTTFSAIFPALVGHLCGFYLLLHAWLNASAELLRFADRQFYTDWWTQKNYAGYYRTWNIVIHDWLHTYIYRDVITLTGSRLTGTLSVFIVSAIFHEVILMFGFGFFFPLLLCIFGFIGIPVVYLTKNFSHTVGNIFLWLSLMPGYGLLWTFYGIEYFSRVNCPTTREYWADFWTPRMLTCHKFIY